jgi:uncharacterized membrane protein required for colicin V production
MKFDLILLAVAAAFGFYGFYTGAMAQLKNALGMLAAYFGARPLAALLTPRAAPQMGLAPPIVNLILSGFLFCALYSLTSWLVRKALVKMFPDSSLGRADRVVGFLTGTGKGVLVIYAALSFYVFFEKPMAQAFGAPPPAVRESACVELARQHDLLHVIPVPALKKLEKLVAAARNPEAAEALAATPELKRLLDDPQLKAALQNDELTRGLMSGDLSALKDAPSLQALLKDPKFSLPTDGPDAEPR